MPDLWGNTFEGYEENQEKVKRLVKGQFKLHIVQRQLFSFHAKYVYSNSIFCFIIFCFLQLYSTLLSEVKGGINWLSLDLRAVSSARARASPQSETALPLLPRLHLPRAICPTSTCPWVTDIPLPCPCMAPTLSGGHIMQNAISNSKNILKF